jgi:hypothetical protein
VRTTAALPLLLLLAGCFSLSYTRSRVGEPVPAAALDALCCGDDLSTCMAALGPPDRVFAHGDAVACLWFWRDVAGWGFEVSSPFEDVPGSVTLDLETADAPACVLWFASDLTLVRWQSGTIGELLPDRVRPAFAG